MQKRFLSSLLISLFLNFLIKPISVLVIDAGVQRALGNVIYGKYFTLLSLTVIFNVFLDLGINNYTVRNIAQDESRITHHLNNIIGLRLLLFLCYSILICCFAYGFNLVNHYDTILMYLIINQFLVQSIALLRSVISGQHRFYVDATLSVLDRALLIIMVGWAFIYQRNWITIEYFVLVQTFSYAITLLCSILSIKSPLFRPVLRINWKYVKEVLKHSLPFALLILLMFIYNRSDVILIRMLSRQGDMEAGIYAQSFRLYDALFMVGMIFTGLLFPMFSRMLHKKDPQIVELITMSQKWLIGGVLAIVFVVNENATHLLSFLYGNHASPSSSIILKGLMIAYLAMSLNFIYGTLLTANGSLSLLIKISAYSVLISLLFNLFLIPQHGATGAVVTAIIVQLFVSTMLVYYALRIIPITFRKNAFNPLILYSIYLLIAHFLFQLISSSSFGIIGSIITPIFGLFLFNVIDVKAIYSLYSRKETHQ